MKFFTKALLWGLAIGFGALLSGCSTKTENDTSIPWSRPADWEGTIPGMGSPTPSR